MQNPDRFGFYQIGTQRCYSKLEAIELQQRTGDFPHWNFNDSVYSAADWKIEPGTSLWDLYRKRAQQLRDEYDYLVLWYSGGADSDNILDCFIDNNIRLDEVLSCVNYSATQDRFDFMNAEIFNVAVPKIEQVRKHQPDLVHRVLDICQAMIDWFDNPDHKFNWIYHLNSIITVNGLARQDIMYQVPEWMRMIDQGKTIAFVFGTDKPRLAMDEHGRYIFRFIDLIDNVVSPRNQTLNRPWDNPEFFYWTPDAPDIVIKQAHVIRRYLQSAKADSAWMSRQSSGLAYTIVDGEPLWLTMEGVHRLIYPTWRPIPYQVKPRSPLWSPRDDWFRRFNESEMAYRIYKNGMIKRWQMVPDFWKNDPADSSKGYKCSLSKAYVVG